MIINKETQHDSLCEWTNIRFKKDDLIFLGFEDKEKELLLQNLTENVNTFSIYDEKKA